MINENEVYSLRQLEAFNALSPSDKLILQTKTTERSAEQTFNCTPKQETIESSHIKLELDEYSLNKSEQLNSFKASDTGVIIPEDKIRRVLIANQLNSAVAKANPKAVTASVFKALPIVTKQQPKTISVEQLNNGNGVARAPPHSVTTSLIQPIVAVKRDSFGKIQSNIAKATSVPPRQTVVTASLFQPLSAASTGAISSKFPSTPVNQSVSRAAETMNKSFCMLSDDLSQPTCEYKLLCRRRACIRTLTALDQNVYHQLQFFVEMKIFLILSHHSIDEMCLP